MEITDNPNIKQVKEDINLFLFNHFNFNLREYKFINDTMEKTIRDLTGENEKR